MKTECEMCGDKAYKELETPDGVITMCKDCYESYTGFCGKENIKLLGGNKMIKKVREFSIGDIVIHDKKRCEIISFPTRYSVYIKILGYTPGDFSTAKVSIREITERLKRKKR